MTGLRFLSAEGFSGGKQGFLSILQESRKRRYGAGEGLKDNEYLVGSRLYNRFLLAAVGPFFSYPLVSDPAGGSENRRLLK